MKLNPNEPCHCGSEKKYKKCCMLKDEKEARDAAAATAAAAAAAASAAPTAAQPPRPEGQRSHGGERRANAGGAMSGLRQRGQSR